MFRMGLYWGTSILFRVIVGYNYVIMGIITMITMIRLDGYYGYHEDITSTNNVLSLSRDLAVCWMQNSSYFNNDKSS
jgi:hypothetical protein